MSKSFSEYRRDFMAGCQKSFGFTFAFMQFLTAIPAGIGHIIDSLFNLNGRMFSKDKNQNMHGPFGFILGLPFAIVGLTVGFLLQIIVSIPSAIGFAIDRFIGLFAPSIKKGMIEQHGNIVSEGLRIISGLFRAKMYKVPLLMEGPFGFFFGIVPEIIRGLTLKLFALPTSLINKATNSISNGISKRLYKEKPQTTTTPTPTTAPNSTATPSTTETKPGEQAKNQAGATTDQPKKRRRGVRFNADLKQNLAQEEAKKQQEHAQEQTEQQVINDLVSSKIDLFKLFKIDRNQSPPAKCMLTFAPDKFDIYFKPAVTQALQLDSAAKVSKAKFIDIDAQTFLTLTEIDHSKTDDETLKSNQQTAFQKLTAFREVLDDQNLRQKYISKMFGDSTASMTSAFGGRGDASPVSDTKQTQPTYAVSPDYVNKQQQAANNANTTTGRRRRIKVVDPSAQPSSDPMRNDAKIHQI